MLLDTDVNVKLKVYLEAVGFDVVFANDANVNIHDDTAILVWARNHHRIFVTHDRFKDGKTKFKLYNELYENGGHAIQIGGGSHIPLLTSLGKILIHREDWVEFFDKNDGMVLVHKYGMKLMPRAYLHRNMRKRDDEATETYIDIALKAPRHKRKGFRRPKDISPDQIPFTKSVMNT